MKGTLFAALAAMLVVLPAAAQSPQRPPGLAERLVEAMMTQARRANVPAEHVPALRDRAACTVQILVRSSLSNAVLEQAALDLAAGRQNAEVARRTDLQEEAIRRCPLR